MESPKKVLKTSTPKDFSKELTIHDNLSFMSCKKSELIKASRTNREKKSFQQLLCIGLLSHYVSLVIKLPIKKSHITMEFIKVKNIHFKNGESFEVEDFIIKRCNEIYNNDITNGIPLKTAQRRLEVNKKIETIHFLQDLLLDYGYFFTLATEKGKKSTNKLTYITEVFKDGKCIFSKDQLLPYIKSLKYTLKSKVMNHCGYFKIESPLDLNNVK
ncbi:hypothetical protein EHI8A_015470 [Entamoeba histolytica HM-1:IMSS-B]|uniref:Uncharacterized protein n=6 Tax=Entamoeba histolytica TaxID=5759 RepID=C4M6W5_ENTH1|nr:hypothetical protein EHI_139400 [Entamoeba histolytica HM-1:IMSS]EMD49770.1 TATA-binding associated phosphoprotein, putative [Entamoeba histolytica KU27]EMH75841.1 hypothetical protein EHI8A_015470 [Entamoeba histolytica HM-1:IMSS-B]EMS14835.1 TATA-binding protein-associated phosphoprotein, putative [Entamoeba histolytica HM-3:IMSS]ENY60434.1 TATA-binding protein-associated phosphoprotein, putative [Entamoeba histolytica HM-1:IMSS-A]GAT97249.1 hypothetical protein CL6EHI_139400 [Entamoeba h|eukprot:XP_651311.1 hypothetical protein EHI_139400 [Entamoeba histolytica HM-1:IMSS]